MLSKEQLQKAREFFVANQLAPPYDYELESLADILAERERTPAESPAEPAHPKEIAHLLKPWDCEHNRDTFVASVRKRLSQTVERVTVRELADARFSFAIERDAKSVVYVIRSIDGLDSDRERAKHIAAGLRAELEKESK